MGHYSDHISRIIVGHSKLRACWISCMPTDSFMLEMYTKTVIGIIFILLMLFSLYFVCYLKSEGGYSAFPFRSYRFNTTRKKSTRTPLAQLELDFQDYLKSIQEPRNCSEVEALRCGHNDRRCYVLHVFR